MFFAITFNSFLVIWMYSGIFYICVQKKCIWLFGVNVCIYSHDAFYLVLMHMYIFLWCFFLWFKIVIHFQKWLYWGKWFFFLLEILRACPGAILEIFMIVNFWLFFKMWFLVIFMIVNFWLFFKMRFFVIFKVVNFRLFFKMWFLVIFI